MTTAALNPASLALPAGFLPALSPVARQVFAEVIEELRPSARMVIIEWSEKHRKIATGSRKGDFRADSVPVLKEILEAFNDPTVREIVFKKPSQIGYTVTVLLNVLLYHVDQDPCAILVLFAKDGAGKKFCREKLDPTIEQTECVAAKINTKSRNPDNTLDYKGFPGGFIQLAGVNSPSNVKSTDARIVCVEEPDDVGHDVKGQGDAIALGKARSKTFADAKILVGGTPTIEDYSAVDEEMKLSDRRRAFVDCPHCGHEQTLQWRNVEWLDDAVTSHPVFGSHRPETARYRCDNDECSALWTDYEKNQAIRTKVATGGLFKATAPFNGIAGFDLGGGGELYSVMDESRMEVLVRRYLTAKYDQRRGKADKMIEFYNGTLAMTWRLKADTPKVDTLIERVSDYAPWTCPAGGLVLVASVDVQRGGESTEPRLEYKVKAFGRGMESWRIAYGTVPGNPLERSTWDQLETVLGKSVRNHGGGSMTIRAVSIDASDGMTSDAVYSFCRRHKAKGVIPVKGWNETGRIQREIFSPPKAVDTMGQDKASRYGLKLYMVGTNKAKDQIYGRLRLDGEGPGRMHFDADTDEAYFEGLTSEAKMPLGGGRVAYVKKAGVANEPLDLEVMCLHAAHKLRLHTWDDRHWSATEVKLRQRSLLDETPEQPAPTPARPAAARRPAADQDFPTYDW